MQPIKIDIRMSNGNWQIIMTVPRWLQRELERQQHDGAAWHVFNTWITSGSDDGDPAGYGLVLHKPTPPPTAQDLPTTVNERGNDVKSADDFCDQNPLGLWAHTWVDIPDTHSQECRHCKRTRIDPNSSVLRPDLDDGGNDD